LVIDSDQLSGEAFAAYSIAAVSSVMLLNIAAKLGPRYFSFAKIASLGLPGTVGFTALYFAMRLTLSLNVLWVGALGLGYAIQAITLIGARPGVMLESRRVKIQFWLIVATQFSSGIALFWMEKGGLK
jgi:hypothetical protein